MKIFFRRLHLYLALVAGLVFFVQCLTGTVLVFEEEITHALHPERYAVAVPVGQSRLALAQLASQFEQANPKSSVLGFKVYADPARTVELMYRDGNARPDGPRHKGGARGELGRDPAQSKRGTDRGRPERGSTAYLNPYTGQVLGLQTEKQLPVFKFAEDLHRRLLAGEVGKALTGLSAIFILFITGTGLVLWWPKTRAILRGRLRIKWGASGKRLTHDLHVVLGFYCSLFLFGLAFTGVIMSYRWATETLFTLTNSRPTAGLLAPVSARPSSRRQVAYDAALRTGQATYRTAEYWRVGAPKDSAAAITVSAPSTLPLRSAGLDTLFADRRTGVALGQHLYTRQTAGAQLRRLAKPLHTGEIGGIWTKALVLVVTLCSLTFPVTGVLLWLNRTRKKSGKARRRTVAQPIAG
ncbi:PepSY domain-containing protein [Hymenobacter sp. BRD128]|uniref:PepSY-associated TM helix domain-containing protein n=1 Tax=Hymenobacter sp. BRD128 TaxID=2675878 RepID=UPI0015630748|nr:PepSY-associated TM helix domain-containing protein [Hymenobacter sp. BRD128]QKG57848.1 PepSY domain-containing protein [Hymenobacter sp. BRD128]